MGRRYRRIRVKVLVFLFLCVELFARASVWKISDAEHTMYIGGTIHVLRASDYPLPKEFDEAYNQSDYVVFETDLALAQSRTLQRILAQKMMLPAGQRLSDKLSPDIYSKLKSYIALQGYTIEKFDRLHPWAVILSLTQLKLSQIGIDQSGVDSYYSRRSRADHIPQQYLESVEEQSAIITEIGKGEEDAVILQTLSDMETLPSMMEWMVKEWREGKTERLRYELVDEMRSDSPKMYNTILKQRNEAWMPKLIALLHDEKRGFVLVGAMHLLGRDGLLEQFRKQGYRVEYLEKGK